MEKIKIELENYGYSIKKVGNDLLISNGLITYKLHKLFGLTSYHNIFVNEKQVHQTKVISLVVKLLEEYKIV